MHPKTSVDTRAGDTQHYAKVDTSPLHICMGGGGGGGGECVCVCVLRSSIQFKVSNYKEKISLRGK